MNAMHGSEAVDLRAVDLNLLVTLEAVVDEGSVSRAAERLGMTQSAVSHALGRLRRTFRDELLVRTPQGMRPTPRGAEIAGVLSTALGDVERVLDEQRGFDPAVSERSFRLTVSEYVAPFLLPGLCQRLRSAAPGVELRVAHFARPDGQVDPHEVHVRVAHRDDEPVPGARDLRLLTDEYVVLMSRDHPQAGRPMTLRRYLALRHVKVAAAALGTNAIDDALATRGQARRVAVTVPSWFELRHVVATTDLVLAMPRGWATRTHEADGCVWQPLPLDEVDFRVDLRWRKRDEHDPGHAWLRSLVAEVLAPAGG